MKICVSVIIPAYNVEKYVEDCLNSILNQTLKEIQVICVNDGSTDKTLSVLESCAENDSRISIISQDNSGQSAARNRGLTEAAGEYLYFMDADDILEVNALEELYAAAEKNHLDALYFDGTGFCSEGYDVSESLLHYYLRENNYPECCAGAELFRKMTDNNEFRASPCLQLIRTQYLRNSGVLFHEGIIFEDNVFTLINMVFAQRTGYIKKAYFKRRYRAESTTTSEKKFRHCYGYFACYHDLLALEERFGTLSPEQQNAVYRFMDRLVHNSRLMYSQIAKEEKEKQSLLSPAERSRFEIITAEPAGYRADSLRKGDMLSKIKKEKQDAVQEMNRLNDKIAEKDKKIVQLEQRLKKPLVRIASKISGN